MNSPIEISRFHVLSYSWDEFIPRLEAYDENLEEIVSLPLDKLNVTISEERRCIGSFGDKYRPCLSKTSVGRLTQCRECMGDWADIQKCIFEPQCEGDGCEHNYFCNRLHVVYLAVYGTLVKVGMTSASRLIRRGIEQGADAIVPIFSCRDRQEARNLEKETSMKFGILQEIRATKIATQWTHPPSKDVCDNILTHYRNRIASWRSTIDEEITHLENYPIKSYPRTPPKRVGTAGNHVGKVLGVKGRFMLYRSWRGNSKLLNLNDIPSRTIVLKAEDSKDYGFVPEEQRRWEQRSLDLC
ncbi:MAG: DUF2797 domain-containing protein [Euryarchaeota archaeon]|nr:DUF2797 domain-containing protein [Euryarchaeota archaeon]